MGSLFSPDAPDTPPIPDRGDVTGAAARERRRASRTGRNQTLLTAIRDRGNTGQRPRSEASMLLSGG